MIFEGYFSNYDNSKRYWIRIGDTGATRYIQDNDSTQFANDVVCFATDPITITSDNSDTFENVYIRSCTVSLVANYNICRDVTANNYTDIPVIIRQSNYNGTVIFKGYVEPLSFNQSYSNTWNAFDLNCVDLLGIAEYIKFHDLFTQSELDNMDYMKPRTIIDKILTNLGFSGNINYNIVNDKTDDTLVNPQIFIGANPDEYKNCKEVLSTIGKTYGCWFYQTGAACWIENILRPTLTNPVTFTSSNFRGTDANLSLAEAYNQVKLTCNIETPDTTLVDPFDDDLLRSPFPSLYEYMEEIVAPGEGEHALNAFKTLARTSQLVTDYEPAAKYKHFAQVYDNPLWNFGNTSYATQSTQLDALDYVYNHSGSAGFFAFGTSENINNPKNRENIHSIDTNKYFVINVDGHQRSSAATMETQIQNASPLCTVSYTNTQNFIPNDQNTTNYLVISGKILLQPIVPKTGSSPLRWDGQSEHHYDKSTNTLQSCIDGWNNQRGMNAIQDYNTMWHRTIPHPENGDGAYYQQKFVTGNSDITLTGPIENEKLKKYKYEYSTYGSKVDMIDKVSMLACRLKIGTKYCVERLDLRGNTGINKFEWIEEDDLPTVDGTTLDFFTIGINPKIDDYIVGTSFDICDTRTLEMNIDKKGTCIPIIYNDKLHGNMTFEILGPYNIEWTDTKQVKHGALWWKSYSYSSSYIPILEQIQSIFISNFKIDLVSNNAGINNNSTDNDLVYYSKQNVRYVETKEYDTDLSTSLTTEEATTMGIEYNLSNNTILEEDYTPFYGFDYIDKDNVTHEGTKLEEARVFEQYQLWKEPREIVEVDVKLSNPSDGILNTNYKFSNKWQFDNNSIFKCIGREIDLKYDEMKLTLKNMKGMNTDA